MYACVGKSGVHDGDTPHLDVCLERSTSLWLMDRRCRMARINAPELSQPGGYESSAFLLALLEGQALDVVFASHLDNYGRPLIEIRLADGRNVSDVMLAEGKAVPYGS